MNPIIESLRQNASCADILKDVYGISSDEHFDAVFIAPSWAVEKVFDLNTDNVELAYQDQFSISHRITRGDKKYLYVRLDVGAPNIIDFCLSCYNLDCDKFVFVGAIGALVPGINVGDLFVPSAAISGNGASLYLHEKLDSANLFERTYSDKKLTDEIRAICMELGLTAGDALPISMDTLMCEYLHLDEFRDMGAQLIDMEVATFLKAMSVIEKPASSVLIVSDNSASGEHLIGRSDEQRAKYHAVRARVREILFHL